MNDKIALGIILLVATILIGWLGGAICILAGLIISIVLIVMGAAQPPDKVNKQSDSHYDRYCPNCGRSIPFDANICPYCGKNFDDARKKNIVKELQKGMEKNNKVICPSCGFENKLNSKYCKKCGAKIDV